MSCTAVTRETDVSAAPRAPPAGREFILYFQQSRVQQDVFVVALDYLDF